MHKGKLYAVNDREFTEKFAVTSKFRKYSRKNKYARRFFLVWVYPMYTQKI